MSDISDAFHEYFEIVVADTLELKKEVYRLRYRVMCLNTGIFDTTLYPDELEKDEFDDRSLHILLRHKPSNAFMGTARLILSSASSLMNQAFPVEFHTQFYPAYSNMNIVREHTVEISRFAIHSDFFRRKDDFRFAVDKAASQGVQKNERRRFPHPMLGLAVGIIQLCAKYNFFFWFSAMDPALNRLLGFYGMQLNPIGPIVDYYGPRRPYHVCVIDVLERMYTNYPEVWELVTDNGRIWPSDLQSVRERNQRILLASNELVTC